MYLIGLTGGIAAGKSAVAEHWVTLGGIEIDADVLAREAVLPGTIALREIAETFGQQVVAADGSLDRKKLAEIVFADGQKRAQLEAIVHPAVRSLASSKIAELPDDSMVIYTVPLLVEASVDLPFDKVVTVEAPQDVRVSRMVKTRGMKPDEALARIRSQASAAARANRADVILNSNQPLALLLKDATQLWRQMSVEAANKAGE